jgi:alpha-ketoglutarate-dependent taurine dioxygenase
MLIFAGWGRRRGVEVTGIDVKTMGGATWNSIYQAWLDHNVMVVRDQELTIPDFIAYSERFGPVTPHPSKSTRHPSIPRSRCSASSKFDADGKLRDEIYQRGAEGCTPTAPTTRRRSRRRSSMRSPVPSRGGNTLFANAYAAYDALPQRLKSSSMG